MSLPDLTASPALQGTCQIHSFIVSSLQFLPTITSYHEDSEGALYPLWRLPPRNDSAQARDDLRATERLRPSYTTLDAAMSKIKERIGGDELTGNVRATESASRICVVAYRAGDASGCMHSVSAISHPLT